MPLVLAGGGVWPGSLTRELLELASAADRVYVDVYTSPGASWLASELERVAPGRVVRAGRDALESGAPGLVEEARRGLVLVVAPGDPLVATTHVSLLVEAARRGVEWRVAPGVSGVVAAKALSGLQYYRFGRTFTIPGPWRGVRALSVVDYAYTNVCAGLHSTLLLDVDGGGRQLPPGEAAGILLSLEEEAAGEYGIEPFLHRLMALVISRAGEPGWLVGHARLPSLGGVEWSPPATIIVPAVIHPTEAEALQALHGVDPGLVEEHNRAVARARPSACRVLSSLAGGSQGS
ncbi:diphthine synthase [Stetteria hydrogenophila]